MAQLRPGYGCVCVCLPPNCNTAIRLGNYCDLGAHASHIIVMSTMRDAHNVFESGSTTTSTMSRNVVRNIIHPEYMLLFTCAPCVCVVYVRRQNPRESPHRKSPYLLALIMRFARGALRRQRSAGKLLFNETVPGERETNTNNATRRTQYDRKNPEAAYSCCTPEECWGGACKDVV